MATNIREISLHKGKSFMAPEAKQVAGMDVNERFDHGDGVDSFATAGFLQGVRVKDRNVTSARAV